jgi:hypothetical protein
MTLKTKSSDAVSSILNMSGRRGFISRVCGAAVTTALVSTTGRSLLMPVVAETTEAAELSNTNSRINQAYKMREKAARYQRDLPVPNNSRNGDEELYPTKIANYTKGLQHDDTGRVAPADYDALVNALATEDFTKIETLVLGGGLKLVNPQAGICFGLEGGDSHHFGIIAPPAFSSAQQAGEMAELYWHSPATYLSRATKPIL